MRGGGVCAGFSQGNDSDGPIIPLVFLWVGNSRFAGQGDRPDDGLVAVMRQGWSLVVLVSVAAASGCTLCPSPYDYSGPVPNGSVTQNDFCARSGGTRPLRSGPLVWPQVVQADAPETLGEESREVLATDATDAAASEQSVLAAVAEDDGLDAGVIVTSAESDTEAPRNPIWRRLIR